MSCLDGMVLSDAQRRAVLDPSARLLVAAGAGSGKTSLLVAYFLHALLDEGVPIDQLVAVTFTRKAAGELVGRLRQKLEECGRPDLAHALDEAMIGTIHSLCRRILHENSLQAGVDPAFTVLDNGAAELLKREAADEAWADAVAEADESLLAVLARHEKVLRSELVPLYDKLRGAGQEAPRVEVVPQVTLSEAGEELERALVGALEAGRAAGGRSATLDNNLSCLSACLEWSRGLRPLESGTNEDCDALSALMRSREFFPKRHSPFEGYLLAVREALTSFRTALAETQLRPLIEAMNDVLSRLHGHYTRSKQRRGVLDFADLELRARALLSPEAAVCPSPFGPSSRVMIDEFQDTNELQCSILEGLGAGRLLMVGDDRQSIYRFRGADVEVFARRLSAYATGPAARRGQEDGGQALHRLDANYRSSAEVLAFVNRLFAHRDFFGPDFAPLQCGRAGQPDAASLDSGTAVDMLAVQREDEEGETLLIQEAEARAAARYLDDLLSGGTWQPGDVVILTPALTHARLYEEALRARGIDSYLVRGKGYYSLEEIADVRCLLRLLIDPHDDLALVTVLRSPLVELSDDALYLLGRSLHRARGDSLWQAVSSDHVASLPSRDEQLLAELRSRLADLRRRVGRPGLAALIDDAITAFGYDLRLLAGEGGDRRFANIRKLMRLAEEFEGLHGPDLAAFVEVIATMEDISDHEGSAATLPEEGDVVRIMTIHQAKGLEFPVVVLTGLGSDVRAGGFPSFVVDQQGRVGVFLKGSKRTTYEDQDLCCGPGLEIVREEMTRERQEDMRLLYVAMTRAKERLVLAGARSDGDGLEKSRLGRIIRALGLDAVPPQGTSMPVPGLDATVRTLGASEIALPPPTAVVPPDDAVAPATANAPGANTLEATAGTGAAASTLASSEGAERALPTLLSPAILPRKVRRLSFSSLAFYRECPRRFYLERMLGLDDAFAAPPENEDDGAADARAALLDHGEIGGGSGREVGLLVHSLLERATLHGPRPSAASLRHMAIEAGDDGRASRSAEVTGAGAVPATAAAAAPTSGGTVPTRSAVPPPTTDELLERAVTLARAFWDSPIAHRAGLRLARKEAPFFFLQGDLLISGVFDLMWQEQGCSYVVDYKTNVLAGRSLEKAAEPYGLQMALYALALLRAGSVDVSTDLLFLERPEQLVGRRYGREDLPRLEQEVEQALRPLREGLYPAAFGSVCRECGLAALCRRLEPAAGSGEGPSAGGILSGR